MRILVIEDNEEIRSLLKIGLEAEMFLVDTALDGEVGSYTARTNDYDLIILDNILPKKTGEVVCREIRMSGSRVPIILLSVEYQTSEKVRLLQSGADDYMTKPFSFHELLARIHAVLRRPDVNLSEDLEIGDLVLNSRTHEVKLAEASIYLTKKEFSLLELLLRHQGEVVSRGTIMEHVWDMDVDPFSNTIETHIFNLRRKIEKSRKRRLIWNVPGRGYRLSMV